MSKVLTREYRIQDIAERSPYYHWAVHVLVNFSILVGPLVYLLNRLIKYNPMHLFILLPVYFFIWSMVEYALHRFVLHGGLLSETLTKEHAQIHHHYFNQDEMFVDQPMDLRRVFLLSHHLLLVFLVNLLLSGAVELSTGTGWIFLSAGLLYLLVYELIHAFTHFSIGAIMPGLEGLRRHHEIHHHLGSMSSFNFAIVFPFLDRWFGTGK